MKKALLVFGLICYCLSFSLVEAKLEAKILNLRDSNGAAISDTALSTGVAIFSETINVEDNAGFLTLLVTEDKAGALGDVDITAQYSVDGTNWAEAYTTTSGAVSKDSIIIEGLRNITQWIVHTARLSKYLRYKFDPDADSEITATVIFQRDQ